MTEPPAQAAGLVATGRSEGDAYPLPSGVPLAPTERLGDMAPVPGGRRPAPLYTTPSE
ncbi:hypothetical protein [Streptomyces hyaluromycini]|uniref:hypothetical protein n=1 Tax=Streptomyces hyaluromycini TaxID=1377993 RepID=UPI00142DCF95|nr:hypothetical protein [Streptomyces hyaluromycini]